MRSEVIRRANNRCEYCLFPQESAFLSFEIEHIISLKHGGSTSLDNLALACPDCNRFKGTDIGSLDPVTGVLVPFFNPRQQNWFEHFEVHDGPLIALSAEARVTVKILQLNRIERAAERRELIAAGVYL